VKQISVQNACLLLKLLHCLHHPAGSSWAGWVRQHVDIHTLGGDVVGAHWDALRSLLPAYRQITHVGVRDGGATAFWEDRWNGEAPLCSTYPVLYSHVARHGASIQEVAHNGLTSYLVPCLSVQARSELASVQERLCSWVPQQGEDDRGSSLEGDGHRLITGKIYKLATSSTVWCEFYSFVWQCHAEASPHKRRLKSDTISVPGG